MTTTIELTANELRGLCKRFLQDDQQSHSKSSNDQEDDLQVVDYKLKAASDAPAGFLGRHQFLTVEIELKNSDNTQKIEKLHFFTKTAPTDIESRMDYLDEFGVFKKEILVYRDILPKLQEIIPNVAPKCYYADNNALIFENLARQNYRMGSGRDGLLNYEHLNCCLKTLAALHASSIVLEARVGRKLNEIYPDGVIENAYPSDVPKDHLRRLNFDNAVIVLKEAIKTMTKYKENLDFILKQFPQKMSEIFELAKVSTKYQNVFTHGDLWANNIMFRYGKFGDLPIESRFVDFQLARYAPPMLDLMTIVTIPTSRTFRKNHLNELLADYYRFIGEFLKREHLNINDFMTEKEFYNGCHEFRIAGLIESCLFTHITALPPESTIELTSSTDGFADFFSRKRVEICMNAFKKDQIYRERLTDMLEDFIDNFVLDNK